MRGRLADSLVTFTPISKDGNLFYYNIKQNLIILNGELTFNGKEYNLNEFTVSSDSGRGVWPLKSGWVWRMQMEKPLKETL